MSQPSMKLRYYPYPSLRQQALIFEDFSLAPGYYQAMLEIMYTHNGCGLAANQVGLLYRILVMDISDNQSQPMFMANPEIIQYSSQTHRIEEGCLSLPGISLKIERPQSIIVKYYDTLGMLHEDSFEGLASTCVQHEIDHLNGKLFPDRAHTTQESAKLWKKYNAPKQLTAE